MKTSHRPSQAGSNMRLGQPLEAMLMGNQQALPLFGSTRSV